MKKKERQKKVLEDFVVSIGSLIYLACGVGSMVFSGWMWLLFQVTGLEANIGLLVMPILAGLGIIVFVFSMLVEHDKKGKKK